MKKNDAQDLQNPKNPQSSKAAKAASVTAGIAAGTAAVTGAKLVHDVLTDNDEIIPMMDADEVEIIAEGTPHLNLDNLSGFTGGSSPIAQNLHNAAPTTEGHHAASEGHHAPTAEAHHDNAPSNTVEVETAQDEVEVIVEPVQDLNVSELELNIVGYDTVTMNDGSQSDFAYFEHNGHSGAVVDTNQDGRADFMMYDNNGNGDIEEVEVYDVRTEDWDMASFNPNSVDDMAVAEPEMDIVQEPEPDQYYSFDDASSDYINDADINDFMEA